MLPLRTLLLLAWLGQHRSQLSARDSNVHNDHGDVHNDHYERWIDKGWVVTGRTVPNPPEEEIDRAVATDPNSAYFWSGRVFPYAAESSVEPIARNIARARGGTTLELALERANIVMPVYNQTDEDSTYIWNYASRQFALRAFGNVVVVRGQTRENNIWDTEEFPALTKGENSNVRCILQMNEDDSFVDPVLIWPEPGSAGYDYCLEQRTAAWRAQATHL